MKITLRQLCPLILLSIGVASCDSNEGNHLNKIPESIEKKSQLTTTKIQKKSISIERIILEIKGMHCQGCADWIARSIEQIEGVSEAKVTHELNLAEIYTDPKSKEKIINQIKNMRYSVTEVTN